MVAAGGATREVSGRGLDGSTTSSILIGRAEKGCVSQSSEMQMLREKS